MKLQNIKNKINFKNKIFKSIKIQSGNVASDYVFTVFKDSTIFHFWKPEILYSVPNRFVTNGYVI